MRRAKADRANSPLSLFCHSKMGMVGFIVFIIFVLTAIIGSFVCQNTLAAGTKADILLPPSFHHLLGTDDMGRDVLKQLVAGSRVSLLVGVLGTLISMVIGGAIGVVAGYFGGKTDTLLMRLTDFVLVLPWMPLMLVLAALLGSSIWNIIMVIGLTGWASTARLIRAQTLSVRERRYIERAHTIGAGHGHIILHHVLPDVFPLMIANTVLITANSILAETTLSFLGMGDPSTPSWGMMLHYSFEGGATDSGAYWYLLPPGICVLLVVLSFTMIGYAFDEILNPKLRRRN